MNFTDTIQGVASVLFGRSRTKEPTPQGGISLAKRNNQAQGAWSRYMQQFEPRQVNPCLYEALRESLPILDAGINRLVTLDGILQVEGDNDKTVAIIEDWMHNVPVNDNETGLQAFYTSQGGELYEQGLSIGEAVMDERGRDVIGLRVADSKGIHFKREGDTLRTYYRDPSQPCWQGGDSKPLDALMRINHGHTHASLTDLGFVDITDAHLIHAVNHPEADNPYGTSMLRSLEFVSKVLLTIQNAQSNVWERFGDPVFNVYYKSENRKVGFDEAKKRSAEFATALGAALDARRRGESIDLSTAATHDDELTVSIIGANGEVLSIAEPAKHLLEQVVSKFGLPAWMLGLPWSTTGIGEQQSIIVLQESQTRWVRREPGLRQLIERMLRARGIRWKRNDWKLTQRLPNLMDEQKKAQAEFMRAQAQLVLGQSGQSGQARAEPVEGQSPNLQGIDNNLRASTPAHLKNAHPESVESKAWPHIKSSDEGEPWADPNPELPKAEAAAIAAASKAWEASKSRTLNLLNLQGDAFTFEISVMPQLQAELQKIIQEMGGENGIITTLALNTFIAGYQAVIDEYNNGQAITGIMDGARAHYTQHGMNMVRNTAARAYQSRIIGELAAGTYDGMNPVNVAEALKGRFNAGHYDWERLARSEMAAAHGKGKLDTMRAQGFTHFAYQTANDSKVSHICRSHQAGNPYPLTENAYPSPMTDSHPNCRCTVRPVEP